MAIKHIKPLRELVPIRKLAILAQAPRTNLHIAAHPRHEFVGVRRAAHAGRGWEARELGFVADDGNVVCDNAELAFERRVRDDDAAEGDDEEEEERDEEGSEHGVWCHCSDELPEADVEDLEEADHHEDIPSGEAERESDTKVPAAEKDAAAEEGGGELGEDGAEGEGGPGVDLGFGFAGFEDVAEGDVAGLELLD
ncbi:hypothetical protein V499_06542 [Pseudogymnoascus sp. VKM F-103]|nr:hypothetical protein V499_06542 [Pseudogymnoascus sp. VKM F-103]